MCAASSRGVLLVAGLRGRVGERDDCVPVLAGVVREFAAAQLAAAPALVEGMLEDVPARTRSVDSLDQAQGGLLVEDEQRC